MAVQGALVVLLPHQAAVATLVPHLHRRQAEHDPLCILQVHGDLGGRQRAVGVGRAPPTRALPPMAFAVQVRGVEPGADLALVVAVLLAHQRDIGTLRADVVLVGGGEAHFLITVAEG